MLEFYNLKYFDENNEMFCVYIIQKITVENIVFIRNLTVRLDCQFKLILTLYIF